MWVAKQVVVTRTPLDLLEDVFVDGSDARQLLTLQSYPFPDKHQASHIGEGQQSEGEMVIVKERAHRKMEILFSSGASSSAVTVTVFVGCSSNPSLT